MGRAICQDGSTNIKRHTYVCAACGGTFEISENWSDEQAHQEAVQTFGRDGHAAGMVVVCDDCYYLIMGAWPGRFLPGAERGKT